MISLQLAIMIPFLAALFIPFLYKKIPRIHIGWIVLIVPTVLFITLTQFIPSIAEGKTYLHSLRWISSYGIHFTTYVDGLSIIFGLLITGIGSLVILYSIYYLSEKESLHHFYIYLLLFMGAMLGVVFSDNLMVLYVFWELTSISSFLLIAFWYHRKKSRYGAQKALLITFGGGIAMLTSFMMIYFMTGTLSVREIISSIDTSHTLFVPALLLLLIGAFTKSAQYPFHIWLPDAMEAPTPVSAYLHSATMVKAGIYLVARFTPVFGSHEVWFWLVTSIGLITLFWGSFNAVRQIDLKALLAYSTISQLGLIMSLFGIGSIAHQFGAAENAVMYTQASFAALFHLVNHSTFKGALFMVVGIVDHGVGTRDIRRLGGLMSFMPVSFTIALIGSFSMAGLPPFNGFLSKEMFFEALVNVSQSNVFSIQAFGILFPVIAWIASVFTFVYCMMIVFKTFFGPYHPEKLEHPAHEAKIGMLIPPIILAVLIIGIFIFPNILGDFLLRPGLASLYPSFNLDGMLKPISIWHGFNPALWMTIGVVVVGIIIFRVQSRRKSLYIPPGKWTFDQLYNSTLEQIELRGSKITSRYMTGSLRDYLVYIFLFLGISVGGIFLFSNAFSFDLSSNAPVSLHELLIALTMMAAGIAIIFAKSRITTILLNGAIGYSIALLFVLFRAPDLALTQLVVETVTTALFLLCFYFLPKKEKEDAPQRTKRVNVLVSILVGVIFVAVALSVQSGRLFESISTYFNDAYELSGANNIVNAILGDFRAFDTMLEVIVLFIGGIGVFTLIKLRARKGEDNIENQ
ncbi:Na+/H+ antiporter subunit A [Lederbergia wuyishanensis]|uniref:Multicomponent Na+:H+ antiporter subunit A n=1 Tax=Lederbergia wuyishanensis TaxID=1347903 RepID=A0ABU0D242_9BACI|nr:Na+/H+ antiporter subunit A [Lederbergia wuyishanensis]MCJ8007360.1 Na+/H+ antiporter subunit A [Lederbergia wuyishanensis]MDQ0342473.1 multicomponent Na+:H+ antiporter subunit A [Lederbergia wuyishanensis]